MPYLGTKGLKASDIRRFNVTGSTSATHTLTWVAPTEQSLIVTINGVKQQEDAYSVSGTTLTLTSALVSSDKMEVVGINDVGTTVTPAQNSVNLDKLATTGTASSSTFLRGDMAWTAVSDTSGLASMQVFTSSGTWTKPSGVSKIKVYVTGGGGGAMNQTTMTTSSGGGGGTAIKLIDVSSISSETITIGSGGLGVETATPSSDGGTSSFGSHCSATGGQCGTQASAPSGMTTYSGGEGGIGSSGNINLKGQGGMRTGNENVYISGGDSFWGGGGRAALEGGTSTDGSHGGGGGCAYSNSYPAGDGGEGIIVIEEYK